MAGMMSQPVQSRLTEGPVLCMDIDGVLVPAGCSARVDVFDPPVPVAIVDDSMAPQSGYPVEDYISQDIRSFATRAGPTLLMAPAQEIGLPRSLVDLLCRFAHNPRDPVFATRDVHRCYPDHRMRWPDPLPGKREEPAFINGK